MGISFKSPAGLDINLLPPAVRGLGKHDGRMTNAGQNEREAEEKFEFITRHKAMEK
jgi:hypothetical protein